LRKAENVTVSEKCLEICITEVKVRNNVSNFMVIKASSSLKGLTRWISYKHFSYVLLW